jgi:hypothetical protein
MSLLYLKLPASHLQRKARFTCDHSLLDERTFKAVGHLPFTSIVALNIRSSVIDVMSATSPLGVRRVRVVSTIISNV